MQNPLVSVVLLTFNHEAFIAECLESVVSQKTDFPFEIIVAEDFSEDGTRAICEAFAAKYPDRIILPPRIRNLGLAGNLIQTLALAKGRFIAFQEGDDHWISESKLQHQADVLLEVNDCIACTHQVEVVNEEDGTLLIEKIRSSYSLPDTINGRLFHTNSWMIRREALPDFEKYFDHLICWDILMELKVLEKGKVVFIDDILSVWRKHEGGNSVKIPLQTQFFHFESLYKTLLREAVDEHNKILTRHYKKTLRNFYSIFALEIARKEKRLFGKAVLNSILWQLGTASFDFKFLPGLLMTLLKPKGI